MANTVDIAPELLEAITKEIQEAVEKDPVLQKVLQSIEDGTVTSADMYKYAERYGEIEADALSKYLTEENLPNGRLYQNIAERTVTPTMRDAEQHVNHVAAEIQTAINKGAGLNIKGIEADVDMDHIEGITKKLSYSESIDRVSYLLRDPMVTTLMHAVDRTIQKNVELHADAGLNPIVKRISVGGCCEWCQERAGTYDYIEDDLWTHGSEVYRRHNFCRCLVLYNPMDGKGIWQNVHHQQDTGSVSELSAKEEARRQARIETERELSKEEFEKRSQRERKYRELLEKRYKEIETGARRRRKLTGKELEKEKERRNDHTKRYYEEVRNRSKYSDARLISKNINGYLSVEEIEEIRQHIFIREHLRDGKIQRFDEDYYQAEAWQRLVSGKEIWDSDIVMLQHELNELRIMQERNVAYEIAHDETNLTYNWWDAFCEECERKGVAILE